MIKVLGWKISLADFRWSSWAIFICAFADASVIPFPMLMLFMTFSLLDITKAYRYALIATLGTLAGVFAGYFIGHFAWIKPGGEFTGFAQYLFNHIPGFSAEFFNRIHLLYAKWGLWILVTSAAIPLPFKIFSISSGVFDTNLIVFGITTLISHGLRFLLLAYLAIKAGHEIKRIIETKLRLIAIVASSCVALIIIVIKIF